MSHAMYVSKALKMWTTEQAELYADEIVMDGTPYEPGTGKRYRRLTPTLLQRITIAVETARTKVEQGEFSPAKYAIARERLDAIVAWLEDKRRQAEAGALSRPPLSQLNECLVKMGKVVAILNAERQPVEDNTTAHIDGAAAALGGPRCGPGRLR